MSTDMDDLVARWLYLQPAARKMAWGGLTDKERHALASAIETLSPRPSILPAGCLARIFPVRLLRDATLSDIRLRLSDPAYELELSNLNETEFETALNAVMVLVRGAGAAPILDSAADDAAQERALRAELMQRRHNLRKLKLQLAVYVSGEAPLHLLNQFEAEQTRVIALEDEIDAMHALV